MNVKQFLELSDRERLLGELKEELRGFCQMIGCSMMSPSCPGSPQCNIVLKAMPWLRNAPYKLVKALGVLE